MLLVLAMVLRDCYEAARIWACKLQKNFSLD